MLSIFYVRVFSYIEYLRYIIMEPIPETILWIHPDVSQYGNLVKKDGIGELPRTFRDVRNIAETYFDATNRETYRLGLMYHQTQTKVVPFVASGGRFPDQWLDRGKTGDPTLDLEAEAKVVKVSNESRKKYPYFSKELIWLIENCGITEIDLLTCDMTVSDMQVSGGPLIRYSLDKTGNATTSTASTNWVLESCGVDVRDIYFEDTSAFTEVLGIDGIESVGVNSVAELQEWFIENTKRPDETFNKDNWLLDVTNHLNENQVLLDLSSTDPPYDFKGKTITLTSDDNFRGLFRSSVTESNQFATIRNLTVKVNTNGYIRDNESLIMRGDSGNIRLENVHVDAPKVDFEAGCGGLVGKSGENRHIKIIGCTSNINISQGAGGICGSLAGSNGSCVISNCLSTGTIQGSGGICGYGAGS